MQWACCTIHISTPSEKKFACIFFLRLLELEARLEQERKTVAQQNEELAFLEQQVLITSLS